MDSGVKFSKAKYGPIMAVMLLLAGRAHGQVARFPVQYSQFYNSYSIINPASCGATGTLEIQLGRQQHGGAWKNISTTFATVACRIKERKTNNFHVAGATFMRDKEGEYLKQSRGYLVYAWHTKLSKRVTLAAGATGGVFSFVIAGSNASTQASDMTFDGSFGLWLYSSNYYIGGSINQIANGEVTPLEETSKLARHYNMTGGYTLSVHKNMRITPRFLMRYCDGFPADVQLAATAEIQDVFVAGLNYHHQRSIAPMVGFENIKLAKGNFQFMFSYAVPVGKTANNIQTYELTLNYSMHAKKSEK